MAKARKNTKQAGSGAGGGPPVPRTGGKEVRVGVEEGLSGAGGDWGKLCLRALHFPPRN